MITIKRTIWASALVLGGFLYPGAPNHALAMGNAAGVSENKNSTAPAENKMPVRTLFLDLKRVNCPDTISSMVYEGIQARLKRIPYCYIIQNDEINSRGIKDISNCQDRECAVKHAKQLDCKKAIIGSITRVTRSMREQLGDEGEYKYIYEVKPYDVFIIKIDLIDVPKGSIDVEFREKAKKNEINAKLDPLPSKLSGYFEPIPPPEPPRLTPWIGVSPSCVIPHGRFLKIIGVAGGVTLDIGLKHLAVPNIYAKISGSYYFISQKKNNIQSYQSGQVSILWGYSFPLPMGFFITPMLGAGCQFHSISDLKYTLPFLLGRAIQTKYYDPCKKYNG
jgi:hypothetical protein